MDDTSVIKSKTNAYRAIHLWVERRLGKPRLCDNCKDTDAKKYEWSNISGRYLRDLTDWRRLCVPCHRKIDFTKDFCKLGHEYVGENIYYYPNSSKRDCRMCRKIRRKYQRIEEKI